MTETEALRAALDRTRKREAEYRSDHAHYQELAAKSGAEGFGALAKVQATIAGHRGALADDEARLARQIEGCLSEMEAK